MMYGFCFFLLCFFAGRGAASFAIDYDFPVWGHVLMGIFVVALAVAFAGMEKPT